MIGLLGSNGYVGTTFRLLFDRLQIPWMPVPRSDLYDAGRLAEAFKNADVSCVINCAGFTGKPNVDACELQKTECLLGNGVLPGIIREACEALNIPWGHVSTGCIFTGRRGDGHGFTEADPPNFSFRQDNCSFYSGAKALGEEVLVGAKRCYVWRLRIPLENTSSPRNYLQKLLSYDTLLEAENSLSQLQEFVQACYDSFRLQIPYGTYNVTNPGSVWTSDVVELIKKSGISQKKFKYFQDESQFMQLAAKTPRSNCVLDSSKAIDAGLKLSPVIEAIEKMLGSWEK